MARVTGYAMGKKLLWKMAEGQAWEWKRKLILFILTVEGRRKEQMNSMAYSTESTEMWI